MHGYFCLISTSTLNPPIYYKPMCTNMSASTNGCIPYMLFEQEAHGPRRSPANQEHLHKQI